MKTINKVLSIAIIVCFSLLVVSGIVSCVINISNGDQPWILIILAVIPIWGIFSLSYCRNGNKEQAKRRNQDPQSVNQSDLSPIKLQEGEPNYYAVKLLEQKLKAGTAYNIAVTGIYGSGKSSVLETLKHSDSEHKFITISLAKLTERGYWGKSQEAQVEYSILQQIFYREDQSQFPFSKVNKIALRSKKDIVWFALNALVFFVCLVVLFEPKFIIVTSICSLFYWGTFNVVGDILAALVLLSQSFLLLLTVTPAILRIKGVKFAIQGNEVELSNIESSIINQYLEEILYIFRNLECDVVIFEDIDRFNKPDLCLVLKKVDSIKQS